MTNYQLYFDMKNLIEALNIFLKYGDDSYPTTCKHDTLYVYGYDIKKMSKEDVKRLDELGFFWDDQDEVFISYRFGSAQLLIIF